MRSRSQHLIFYVIVVAQFCGTSLWFAGNAILPELQQRFHWPASSIGYLTSSTQLGFIAGTLFFGVYGLTDRFSPSKIFFACSIIAAAANMMALVEISSYPLVLVSRAITGFFLAGIYPVGMKIAADWNKEGLGHWLGSLVGALVFGTSFPHALKVFPQFVQPTILLVSISLLALGGGVLLRILVPDGPYRKRGSDFSFSALRSMFKSASFSAPAFGYFGHMWELYTFWAFVPVIIQYYQLQHGEQLNSSMLSFSVIAFGGVGCIIGGKLSERVGSAAVATTALVCSGACCLLSPFIWQFHFLFFLFVILFWGMMVAADSPQFSALVAKNAPEQLRGSAITLVICIGFSITIVSIQLLNYLQQFIPIAYLFLLLAPGPVLGVLAMRPLYRHMFRAERDQIRT